MFSESVTVMGFYLKLCGRSCKGLVSAFLLLLLVSCQYKDKDISEVKTIRPKTIKNISTSSDLKPADFTKTLQNTEDSTRKNKFVTEKPEINKISRKKVEFKRYRSKLREKLWHFRMKNVVRKEKNGRPWIMSYPGKFLKFPHNFEKVCNQKHMTKGFHVLGYAHTPTQYATILEDPT